MSEAANSASSETQRLLRFALVGGVGFFVDAALVNVFAMAINPWLARVGSFFFAVLVTWHLNSRFTFGHTGLGIAHYLSGQSLGIMINYGVYAAVLLHLPRTPWGLSIAVAAGSFIAMFLNYLFMKHWIFRHRKAQ